MTEEREYENVFNIIREMKTETKRKYNLTPIKIVLYILKKKKTSVARIWRN